MGSVEGGIDTIDTPLDRVESEGRIICVRDRPGSVAGRHHPERNHSRFAIGGR